ncbi:hypothetical protein [Spirosoma flavum]|uniref:YtxH domain-containing protein n=1 Tax=Spirosoma flavum TaxID=2048557 RepID=A0ABW6AQH5_9BACT
MKTKLVSAFAFTLLLSVGAYAQDSTAMSKKEIRQQERAERKARVKDDLKNAGQNVKEKAKVADEAVSKEAKKVGTAVNTGLDKAETGIRAEGDKIKAKRDSSRAEKARRDSL